MSDNALTVSHDADMNPSADIIAAYLAHLRLIGRSDYTVTEWGRILGCVDRGLPYGLDAAEGPEIQLWLGQPGWSPATRSAYHTAMDRFYVWATDPRDRWLKINPMEDVTAPPKAARGDPDPCTDDELADMLARSIEPYRTWIIVAAYSGARCLEIARLDREHVDEQQLRILSGKGNKPRVVPTHPLVWETLRDRPPGPLVRLVRSGRRGSGRYVSSMSNHYLHRRLAMVRMHLHRLRHWYATRTLEACGDPRVVQELLGHASLATTQIYTQVSSARRAAAVMALPSLAVPATSGADV